MAANLGWVNIQGTGSSVVGADNGIIVKVAGQQMSGSHEITWDSTAKTLTIAGASASATALSITGKISTDAIASTNEITAASLTTTGEVAVGASGRTMSDSGQLTGNGNSLTISGTEVVPADFRSQVYGPISVSSNANLIIGTGAIIAIRLDSDLPAVLQS